MAWAAARNAPVEGRSAASAEIVSAASEAATVIFPEFLDQRPARCLNWRKAGAKPPSPGRRPEAYATRPRQIPAWADLVNETLRSMRETQGQRSGLNRTLVDISKEAKKRHGGTRKRCAKPTVCTGPAPWLSVALRNGLRHTLALTVRQDQGVRQRVRSLIVSPKALGIGRSFRPTGSVRLLLGLLAWPVPITLLLRCEQQLP